MQEIIAAIISLVLVGPLETGLREKLEAARAPQAIVTDVTSCIEKAAPALAERVWSQPLWFAQATIRVWTGTASLQAVAEEAAPACAPAIRSAAPFFKGS